MQWTEKLKRYKIGIILTAVIIAAASLVISHSLISDLSKQEKANMLIWAEAMKSLASADADADLNLVLQIINSNNTIPVIVTSSHGELITSRNVTIPRRRQADSITFLKQTARTLQHSGRYFRVDLTNDTGAQPTASSDYIIVSYDDSTMLKRLTSYPYVQLLVVTLFGVIGILALLSAKRAEQNRVWVGLSKETAHQLGTPISSLMAWAEILKENYPDDPLMPELNNDIERLQLVADRFSKIGSAPSLETQDLRPLLTHVTHYMTKRTSHHIRITYHPAPAPLMAGVSAPLLEWVIENLLKNAIDAMNNGQGEIDIHTSENNNTICIDVSDTGKGIDKKNFKNIFRPGFTSKERGWGLGLSLAKRIIHEYHHGKIYVKSSELGRGTTFRIELRR